MRTPGFILRLLTLLTYFLPFIFFLPTCTDMLTLEKAYNKREAIENDDKRTAYELSGINSLLDTLSINSSKEAVQELRERARIFQGSSYHLKYHDQDFQFHLIMPSDSSLSGIGAIYFHKNLFGKITITISLCITFLTLLFWRLLDKRGLGLFFILANTVFVGIFVVDCLLNDVTILFGTWILLFLLVAQLIARNPQTDFRVRQKNTTG